jgi:hypothetical protein
MAEQIEWPELVWKEGATVPAVEVSLDFIPEQYYGNWQPVVRAFAAEWVERKSFKKKATIWMWGAISVNLISRHPQNPVPSWSEFLVVNGFPDQFLSDLASRLEDTFDGQAAITEYVEANREAGWTAICHIERGRAWVPVDGDMTWEVFKKKTPRN